MTVSGQTTQFVYDGDGDLVKKIKPDGSSTIYIGSVYEVDKSSGGAVTRTLTCYPAGGAMRIDSTVYYILKDRLGSAYATTDASGNTVGEMRYYASGETRMSTGNMFTDRLFTGQRQIAELGIYQFGARFYSPKLGRFLSADTIVPQPFNPQSLNRYSYANNNPLRYIDPSGHRICDDVDAYGNCITYDYGDEDSSGGDDGSGGGGESTNGGDDAASDPLTVAPTACSSAYCDPGWLSGGDNIATSTPENEPDWEKIAIGSVLLGSLLVLDFVLIYGAIAWAPEVGIVEVALGVGHFGPLIAGIIAVHVYAVDLIVEGIEGQ